MTFQVRISRWALGLIAIGGSVHAQSAPQDSLPATPTPSALTNAPGVGDIVVTARRVSERLQDVPVAITAINSRALQNRGVHQLTDITQAVPNLFIREGPQNPNSAVMTIRGQTQPDQPITIDPAVGLYVDGVNYPRTFGVKGNLIDIDRIEVLRGPQGTLYGKNTTGGAVSVITKSPTDTLGASVHAFVGNYASYGGDAVLNLPVTTGVALRLVGAASQRDDGYGRNGLGQKLETSSNRFVRGKIKLDPISNLTVLISGDYQHFENGGAIGKLAGPVVSGAAATEYALEKGLPISSGVAAINAEAYGLPTYQSASTSPQLSKFTAYGVSLDATWRLGTAIALRSITAWRRYSTSSLNDQDGTSATINAGASATPYDHNLTEEFQVLGTFDKLHFVAGGYASDERGIDGTSVLVLPAITKVRTIFDSTVISRSIAAFAQADWTFSPGWSLTAGVRYTSEQKGIINRNHSLSLVDGSFRCSIPVTLQDHPDAANPADPAACKASLSNTYTRPSWLVSLDRKIGRDVLVYAKISNSFRGGGQNIRGSGDPVTFAPFKPEIATEYEIGAKTELFNRHLQFNVAGYYDSLKDAQRSITVLGQTTTATVLTNAASARLIGGEVEAH